MKPELVIKPEKDREPERREIQCADCLAWIDRDDLHTCRQQTRRNRKVQQKG